MTTAPTESQLLVARDAIAAAAETPGGPMARIAERLVEAFAALERETWVAVRDGLPSPGVRVFAITEYGFQFEAYVDGERAWWKRAGNGSLRAVTHWRIVTPLPPPPPAAAQPAPARPEEKRCTNCGGHGNITTRVPGRRQSRRTCDLCKGRGRVPLGTGAAPAARESGEERT
jgi:hypothetical protein